MHRFWNRIVEQKRETFSPPWVCSKYLDFCVRLSCLRQQRFPFTNASVRDGASRRGYSGCRGLDLPLTGFASPSLPVLGFLGRHFHPESNQRFERPSPPS